MWNELSEPWKAYCNGSIPIGAVIVSSEGNIISRGRNMIYENIDNPNIFSGCKMAHAEMNAMYSSRKDLRGTIIYSTMEPCVMCFGTIVMNGIKEINYAARDGVAGGTNLKNDFINSRNIRINENHKVLEIIQLVIKTDFVCHNFGERAEQLLSVWEETCPVGIEIGRRWHKENKVMYFKEEGYTIGQVMKEICSELCKASQL